MAFIKKTRGPDYQRKIESIETAIELGEVGGIEFMRIRSRTKPKINPMLDANSITTRGVYGFEMLVVNRNGSSTIKLTKIELIPAVDGFLYGYIPKTEHNIRLMLGAFQAAEYVVDDRESLKELIALAKEQNKNIEYTKKEYAVGATELRERRTKEAKASRLAELEQLLIEKEMDDKIAALEAKLALPRQVVEEPIPAPLAEEVVEEVVPEPIVEEPEEEIPQIEFKVEPKVTPSSKKKPQNKRLSGVKLKK